MNYQIVINNLQYITTSRLYSISKLYNCDCNTSNVLRLLDGLQSIDLKDRVEVRVAVNVEADEVLDMIDALQNGIQAYKKKFMVRTFPKNMNLPQLSYELYKLNPVEIVKEVLNGSTSKSDKPMSKADKIDAKKKQIHDKMKLELMSKGK